MNSSNSETMTNAYASSPSDIARAIQDRDDVCICGHINPDGDSIGSILALTLALRKLGKRVVPIVDDLDAIDASLSTLPHADDLVQAEQSMRFDTFISVDVSDVKRLGMDGSVIFSHARHTITIDHHEPTTPVSMITFTDPDSPSTSCLVWDLCALLEVEPDEQIAHCAYAGLMTDTGRFQYSNTTPYAFSCAMEMVAYGIDIAQISADFFQNRTLRSLQLESIAIDHMQLLGEGDIAFSWISLEDMHSVGAKKSDCEGLIDVIRSLGSARIACLLKEGSESVRGSIRSKDGSDVARLAARFGGGGHKAAAGFTINAPLDEAIKMVEIALIQGV